MDYPQAVTRLGLGSVHPGGWSATLEQLRAFPFPAGSRVLEVGCGTGRTACYLARQGAKVTAIDISPAMLAKAHQRALRDRVNVTFRQADVRQLPFPDGQFDAVLAESVSIFTDTEKAISEYFRVLRPGGTLFDREIFAAQPIPPGLAVTLKDFFGGAKLLTDQQWREVLRKAGFSESRLWHPTALATNALSAGPGDSDNLADPGAQFDPAIARVASRYSMLMARYHAYFAYSVFIGHKPVRATTPARPRAIPRKR